MTDADFSSIDAAQPEASTALEQAASHAHICSKLAEQYKSDPVLFAALTDAAAILRDLMRGLGDWVLVPRVPTDAMLRAAQGAWLNDPLRRTTTMWAAMLAAAPQQPAATSETVNVIGMPEFDGLLDHIYEHGTAAEGVIEKANAFARAVLAQYSTQQPAAVDEAMVFRLAVWMAKHDGCEDPHRLIYEGSPPVPWGEVWNRYEYDARAALTAALAAHRKQGDEQ